MSERAEEMRRRYRYRRLIVRGGLRLSRRGAARLVGPDCAYHLYRRMDQPRPEAPGPAKQRGR